jgi:hypothetical protein
MRIIQTIEHPKMRISLFQMNQKYILKFEFGPLEQSYKFDELDFFGQEDFIQKVNSSNLISQAESRFKEMMVDLNELNASL